MTATPTAFVSPAARALASQRTPGRPALARVLLWGSALLVVVTAAVTLPAGPAGALAGCVVAAAVCGYANEMTR